MIIGKYIRKLLEEGNRVILPGFGNLGLADRGEGVPPAGGYMAPPGKTVRFDAGYSKDDGVLAGLLSEGEGIDREEARQRVLELVDAIRFSLDKGEPFTLPGTGTFTRDEDGRIGFRTDPDWVLEPDQFGLESMDLLELEEEPSGDDVLPGYEAGPTAREGSAPEATGEQGTPSGQKAPAVEAQPGSKTSAGGIPLTVLATPEKKRRRRSPWKVIWIVATCLIVILVALILIPEDFFRGRQEIPAFGEPAPVIKQGEPSGEPVQGGEAGRSEEGGIGRSEAGIEEPGAEKPVVAEEASYYVIAGSFENLANASDLQDRLRARGFSSEVMITSNRLYRVTVASFASKEDALEGLERIKATPGLESAWLLSK